MANTTKRTEDFIQFGARYEGHELLVYGTGRKVWRRTSDLAIETPPIATRRVLLAAYRQDVCRRTGSK